jgi:integrase/recombinase XerD
MLAFVEQTAAALRAWLAVRGTVLAPELFVNARREPMTRYGFEYILEKYVHMASKRCPSVTTKRVSARLETQCWHDPVSAPV